MLLRHKLKELYQKAQENIADRKIMSNPLLHQENVVVFSRVCDDPIPQDNAFQFWILVPIEGNFVSLPAATYDDSLIEKLRAMEIGQVFKIVKESEFSKKLGDRYIEAIEYEGFPVIAADVIRRKVLTLDF